VNELEKVNQASQINGKEDQNKLSKIKQKLAKSGI
jgi:hypothetical protein